MRILILNWRDIKNPTSGGAEILTHEIAKRWVALGHEVIQFSSLFGGGLSQEAVDGVKIIRRGKADARSFFQSVHFLAFRYYQKHFKGKVDVVIDEIHGLPFFSPFYVKERKVALICEVAGKIWDVNFSFPFNLLGKFVEKNYFRFYKDTSFMTISESTKKELIGMGIKNTRISILPMGINHPGNLKSFSKEKNLTLIFVGRLAKTKGIEDAIYTAASLRAQTPNIKLWVVGRGDKEYLDYLKEETRKLKIGDNVIFFGFVSEEKKYELMSRAHFMLAPSIKEGWGLIVAEAGFCKTPSVVYDVAGLRDIIKNEVSGIVVKKNRELLPDAIKKFYQDPIRYKKIQMGAYNVSIKQDWDKTAKKALGVLTEKYID